MSTKPETNLDLLNKLVSTLNADLKKFRSAEAALESSDAIVELGRISGIASTVAAEIALVSYELAIETQKRMGGASVSAIQAVGLDPFKMVGAPPKKASN